MGKHTRGHYDFNDLIFHGDTYMMALWFLKCISMNITFMRTLSNHNDVTIFRKRHQLISFYKFQSPKKSTSTIGWTFNEEFYRPLYKEAAYKILKYSVP